MFLIRTNLFIFLPTKLFTIMISSSESIIHLNKKSQGHHKKANTKKNMTSIIYLHAEPLTTACSFIFVILVLHKNMICENIVPNKKR